MQMLLRLSTGHCHGGELRGRDIAALISAADGLYCMPADQRMSLSVARAAARMRAPRRDDAQELDVTLAAPASRTLVDFLTPLTYETAEPGLSVPSMAPYVSGATMDASAGPTK